MKQLLWCLTLGIGMVLTSGLTAAEPAGKFVSLFDGKTLKGWEGDPRFWSVQDGIITGQTTKDNPTEHNTFLVWRDGVVDDFVLELDFRLVGGNSGIQYRSREVDKWVIAGYQADFDAPGKYSGILYEEKGRGILAQRGKRVVIGSDGQRKNVGETTPTEKILSAIKSEQWNHYTVIAQGNHLIQKINGLITVDVTDNQVEKRSMSGLLAFQVHHGEPMKVQFRNVRLKRVASSK